MKTTRLHALLGASLLLTCALLFAFRLNPTPQAAAQTTESFTLKQVLSSPFPSELIAAPKGERIAWAFNAQGKRNVWAAEGPEFKARQLTAYNEDTGQELTNLSFSADGKWVVYVRGGEANAAGDVPNPTSDPMGVEQAIFAVSFETGRVRRIGEGENPVVSPVDGRVLFLRDNQIWLASLDREEKPRQLFTARGSSLSPAWSPDGKQIAFNSSRNTHSFIAVYDFEQQSIRYIAPSVDRDSTPRWSPDGKHLAFIRMPARGNQPRSALVDAPNPWAIWTADVATGGAREVWRSGKAPNDSLPSMAGEDVLQWARDQKGNDRLLFASEMDGWLRLYSIGAGGTGELAKETPGGCEWEQMSLSPDKREVFYSSNCGDLNRRHLWRGGVGDARPLAVTKGEEIEWSPVVTGSGKHVVYLHASATQPASVKVRALDGGEARAIAAETLPKDFPAAQLVTPQAVTFKAADGLEIHGQLFLPRDAKPTDKLPAVIFTHGGPMRQMFPGWHNRYYYHNAYGFNQYLASRGYAVLSVNYRLGIGQGRAFRTAKNGGARGGAEYQDLVAGANFLRARTDIDATKIGLWGGSYGGYLTALGLARNSDLFAAGVDLHGVHDWSVRLAGSAGSDATGRDAVKIAREASPVGSIEKWRSPVLLIHGDDDRNVAFAQTIDLVQRLRTQGVEFEQIIYPDEVHDFLLHRHWLEIYAASARFLDKHLKSRSAKSTTTQRVSRVDLLLRGGSVLDGTGGDVVKADVGITGDRIAFIGDASKEGIAAARVVDATGLTVAPGFIDPHTHADEDLSNPPRNGNEPFLFQGVTTVVIGNDGRSALPIAEKLNTLQQQGIGTNVMMLVGHGSVRGKVIGAGDAAPTSEQLAAMKQMVAQAMEDGAFGMSTGLYYAPGSFAKTEEVIELSKVVAARGGIYDTHMRDESSYNIGLLGSIRETLRIGREAGLPVHISHIKALGTDVWGQSKQVIALIEEARRAGVNATANQYPYTASGTSLTASIVPRWAEAGGAQLLIKRLDDPAVRLKLLAEMAENLRRRGGPDSLLITSAGDRNLVGKRLSAIAKVMGKSPLDAAIVIIKSGGAGVASFNMQEADIEAFMKQPWVMTGSDGSRGHPRKYGTYPRKLRDYVLTRKVISLPRMIEASSAQVANTFGLKERGKLARGYFADVIVFDEKTINERATYEQPEVLAMGMRHVLVNGKLVIEDGKYTGALAGRALRKHSNGGRAD